MSDNYSILTHLKGAVLVVETAATEDLPLPRYITITTLGVDLQLPVDGDDPLAAIYAWAEWFDEPIAVRPSTADPNRVCHHFNGVMYDVPVHVYTYTEAVGEDVVEVLGVATTEAVA